jgi:putative ABC transport system permease protein
VKLPALSSAELARAFEAARDALRTDATRTRAALVALAMAMAIVVCLTAVVERGRAATIRALERAGLHNLYLVDRSGAAGRRELGVQRLTTADADRLALLTRARATLAIRIRRENVSAQGLPSSVPVYAVAGSLGQLFEASAESGRLLGELDLRRKSPYAVLGVDLARSMGSTGARTLTVGGRGYEVVGHLERTETESASTGDVPALDWNRAVVLPMGAEPGSEVESDARYPVDVAVLSYSSPPEAEGALRLAVRLDLERFAEGPVRLASPSQTLRQYKQTRRTFDRLIWVVALLTGASAVFGISNLLSASVIARTREIGVRRAVGARSRDIDLQFRLEGLLLAVIGGGAGLLAGLGISLVAMDRSAGGSWISLASVSALAVSCVAVGVLTGIRPSRRAARVDPAAALRDG